jgi:hypothetical protein
MQSKLFKRLGITVGIIMAVIFLFGSIVTWFVFTPEKLTPIVRKQLPNFITCDAAIGDVELTFFSTFPNFGIKVNEVELTNPTKNAQSNTLLKAKEMVGVIDLMAYLGKNEIVIDEVHLFDGYVNAFVDTNGLTNFDILVPDTTETPPSKFDIELVDLKKINLENINVTYLDKVQNIDAKVKEFYASISGNLKDELLESELEIKKSIISCTYENTVYANNLTIKTKIPSLFHLKKQELTLQNASFSFNDFTLEVSGKVINDTIKKRIQTNLNYGLSEWEIKKLINLIPSNYTSTLIGTEIGGKFSSFGSIKGNYSKNEMPLMDVTVSLKDAYMSHTSIPLSLKSINTEIRVLTDLENDKTSFVKINNCEIETGKSTLSTKGKLTHLFSDIYCDIQAQTKLNLSDLNLFIPKNLQTKVNGELNATLKTKFTQLQLDRFLKKIKKEKYSDTISNDLASLDLSISLDNGILTSKDLPLTLQKIKSKVSINSDLKTEKGTEVIIHQLSAATPQSEFSTKGKLNDLFSNITCELTTKTNILLEEFKSIVPKDLKLKMAGKVAGEISSKFNLKQLEKMLLEKMKFKGDLTCSNIAVNYDGMDIKSSNSVVEFSLPNPNKLAKNQSFISAKIRSKQLESYQKNTINAFLKNAVLTIEASDLRNTKELPTVSGSFYLDTLSATTPDASIAIKQPNGQFTLLPSASNKLAPEIRIAYSSGKLKTKAEGALAKIEKVQLNATIINDPKQKDVFLQWMAKGFLDLENGKIDLADMKYPFEIPAIKLNFTPETFQIKESSLKIDNSDFNLTGSLNNVLSYFRKDSLLRGDFKFISSRTDINQLMNLTNGLGNENANKATTTNTSSSGPYMVPKGIDIQLHTAITKANLGKDTIKKISGDIRVKDGILVLDDLIFTTPAAKMQLTAMYKTPRKNHLYLGMDYHMLNIEIDELLKMIPDIDSIMPMLRSFDGKGEFHIAAETYLDSTYSPKKSTIRASSSIRGQDLVLLDGSTFSEISKKLRFDKRTKNKIDSLSAEFTVFKQEIDVYPFLIVMDKYHAVVEGRHNFDLSFDYHISLVDSPLPVKLGLDIAGTIEKMKYKLVKCKYADMYRPASRKTVQSKQLELRKVIRDALVKKVKE